MRRVFITLLLVILAGILIFGGCAPTAPAPAPTPTPAPTPPPAPAPTKEIVIKAVSALPAHLPTVAKWAPGWIETVNKQAKGEVKIELVGGPEVIAAFDLPDAVRVGAMDMAIFCPPDNFIPLMPVGMAMGLHDVLPWEEREIGAYECWAECYEKFLNSRYIGRPAGGSKYQIYLRDRKIEKVADFKGFIIRTTPGFAPLMEALGASPVVLPMTEMYSAMERGVVDGCTMADFGMFEWGLDEVSKYILEPRFFQTAANTFMNLDVWNSLPKHSQDVILNTFVDVERDIVEFSIKNSADIRQKALDAGIQVSAMSPAESEKFFEILYKTLWDQVLTKDPENGPKFKKLYWK